MSIHLKTFIICIVFLMVQERKACNPSYCNYEGSCEFQDILQKKCVCVPHVSEGNMCEKYVDVCEDVGKGMCKMDSTCK